ncbi:MAG: hypothetical protein JXQ73_08270, partial [Phycisphaerae bacterium]|nr:hypothetical protein [Phycisphaerae bacterium]
FKLFDRRTGRLVASDSGYVGRLRNGGLLSSQNLDRSLRPEITEDRIVIETPFHAVKRTVFSPLTFMAFRLVSLTVGRIPSVALRIKSLLVKVLITRRRPVPLMLRRTIVLKETGIEVRDYLKSSRPLPLECLRREDVFSTVHMGSSRYFQTNELGLASGEAPGAAPAVVPLGKLTEGIELHRPIDVKE